MVSSDRDSLAALGVCVRERRKVLGLTQRQLAERLRWEQERISLLENGKYGMPSLPLLNRLAGALDTRLSTLLEALGYGGPAREPEGALADADPSINAALYYLLQRLLAIETTDLREALNEVSDEMVQAMGADKIDVFMHDPATESLVALGTSNTPMGRRQHELGLDRLPLALHDRIAEVFRTEDSFYTGRADQDAGVVEGIVKDLGVRSMLVVPLRFDGRIRGVFSATSAHEDQFSAEDREFFEAVGRWVGTIARRAELAEALKQQSADEARRAAAEEMVSVLAHDLGNHLTPLRGRIDLLARRFRREGDERGLTDVGEAARAVERMQRLVSDLLDVARLDRGIFSLVRVPADLVVIVRDIAEALRPMRASIALRLPDTLVADVDRQRIEQALHNVVTNAVQHTPEGTPITITLAQERREDGIWAILDVHDEGPGIAQETLTTLFARHGAGPRSSGLGLGLYLARGIVEAHGGTITAESSPGRGTTFRLAFPLRASAR